MNVKVLTVAAMLTAGASLLTLSSCGEKQQQQQAQAPEIATMTLSLGNSEVESSFPAQIKGKTDIEIRPQVTGFITKVHVDEGQRVVKGQTLFTLDQVQFQAAVDQAAAAVRSAQTAVNTAQITADTKRQLLEKNIISQYEYQLAQNTLANAQASLSQANAALANAKKNLSYTVVTAPSNGVVGSIPNREGSLASPSSAQPLTTISDNSEVYAYFSLTEKDLLKLTNGGTRSLASAIDSLPPVQLRLSDGSMYPTSGKVATVSGVINTSTGAASVRALFDNPSGMLRSGSTGSVVMPNVSESVIVIPQKATYELQDRRFVYLVNDSNKIVSAPITVAENNDGKNYVVTSGLKPGDRIAIEGVGTVVKDGIVITPVDPAERAKKAEAAEQQAAAGK
ncbi:MAG: efflux RND transporter periplasmic adaptor subunit [Muribaculaceae bacterium]|nr:efflux RND transporter periplasmic adaptor subunit [Muribaculaceae bacterium]